MTVTSDADEAWWPPTLRRSSDGRSRFAKSIIRVASHSTRRWISSSSARGGRRCASRSWRAAYAAGAVEFARARRSDVCRTFSWLPNSLRYMADWQSADLRSIPAVGPGADPGSWEGFAPDPAAYVAGWHGVR